MSTRNYIAALLLSLAFIGPTEAQRRVDLPGYQNFAWGTPLPEVKSMLISKGVQFEQVNDDELLTHAEINLEGMLTSIGVRKSFHFLTDRLGKVALIYQHSHVRLPIDSIFSKFRAEVVKKYGNPRFDTTGTSSGVNLRICRWDFRRGAIEMKSATLLETSPHYSKTIVMVAEFVSVVFAKKGFAEELDRLQRKKRADEF